MHVLMYRKVKFRDDGRDVVTGTDFVAIHVTFAMMNAWLTYVWFFIMFVAISKLCPYPDLLIPNAPPMYFFCAISNPNDVPPLQQYYYNLLLNPSKVVYAVILTEMVIYLAYYKDIIFSSVVLTNFVGMGSINYNQIRIDMARYQADSIKELEEEVLEAGDLYTAQTLIVYRWLFASMVLTFVFTMSVFLLDLDRSFYLKGKLYKRRVQEIQRGKRVVK